MRTAGPEPPALRAMTRPSIPPRRQALGLLAALLVLPAAAQQQQPVGDHQDSYTQDSLAAYINSSTCMECHSNRHRTDLMATSHWTWNHVDSASGQVLGKKNVINNFCVAVPSNEARCTSCHIGVGWTDMSVEFNNPDDIDCLVCHDTTGTYKKTPTGAGAPDAAVDLGFVAQNVGRTPSRQNCGACHFFGGGGDAVKHGTLDSSMTNPLREVDVHMGTDGGNFTCVRCHEDKSTSNDHDFVGTRYPTDTPDHVLCQQCHSDAPHDDPMTSPQLNARLNGHTDRVSCQACHIPAFARGGKFTKQSWDWSEAGGGDAQEFDDDGNVVYDKKKGRFTWTEKAIPEYRWFNGSVTYATLETPVVAGEVLTLNALGGDKDDAQARLFPVKRFTGRQPYDAGTGRLAVPHLFPKGPTDTEAYWKSYDWEAALAAGQDAVGIAYTGPMGVVDTELFWIQNHMVAPKENALGCAECHSEDSRVDFAALGYPAGQATALQGFFPAETVAMETADPESGVTLRWTAEVSYFRYQVQASDDLVNWFDEPDGQFVSESAGQEFIFNQPMDGELRKFYRVVRTTR